MKKYTTFVPGHDKIVIGTEKSCSINCIKDYVNKCGLKTDNGEVYVNGGFLMGPGELLLEGYNYSIIHGKQDDQIGWGKFLLTIVI